MSFDSERAYLSLYFIKILRFSDSSLHNDSKNLSFTHYENDSSLDILCFYKSAHIVTIFLLFIKFLQKAEVSMIHCYHKNKKNCDFPCFDFSKILLYPIYDIAISSWPQ